MNILKELFKPKVNTFLEDNKDLARANKKLSEDNLSIKNDYSIIKEKLSKLQIKYNKLETDYIKDYEEDEIISYIAEIPYIIKYFDTLIMATKLKRGSIPSNETMALERTQGCLDQINKFKQSVLDKQKRKDNN